MSVESGPYARLASEKAIEKMIADAAAKGFGEARDYLPVEGLGNFAAAVLGHADSGGLLREMRNRAGAGRSIAGAAAGFGATDGTGKVAAGECAGICEHHLPEMRRGGAARDGHDGYVRRFFLVFLPLHGRETIPPRHSARKRRRIGFPSINISAGSNMPFCT